MDAYIVYKQGQRPWPDEVNLLTEHEMREHVAEALQEHLATLTVAQLITLAQSAMDLVIETKN